MARRRKGSIPPGLVGVVLLLALIGWGLSHLSIILAAAGVVGVLAIAAFALPRIMRAGYRSRRRAAIERAAADHRMDLAGTYLRSRRPDGFGGYDDRKWRGAMAVFLDKYVADAEADAYGRGWRYEDHEAAVRWLSDYAAAEAQAGRQTRLAVADTSRLTPRGYEQHCADLLEAEGWTVQLTPPTRDSGADIIATKGRWRVAVECKRYAKPVGNKAVQQVHAARSLYQANAACVVALGGFTPQAEREALGMFVLLLHDGELSRLEALLGRRQK
jgi:restriction system protein